MEEEEDADEGDDDALFDEGGPERVDRPENEPPTIIGRHEAQPVWEPELGDLSCHRTADVERV